MSELAQTEKVKYVAVDRMIYINLDSRVDRNNHMLEQLAGTKWPYTRFSAIRLDDVPEKHGLTMLPRLAGHKGVASIWLSHKKSLQDFLRLKISDESLFILLEDDVVIKPEFWIDKFQLPADLPDDWELLLLTPKYRWRDEKDAPIEEIGRNFAKAPNNGRPCSLLAALKTYLVSGAHFVVFRNSMIIEKTIQLMDDCPEIYDVDLFYARKLKSYGVRNRHVSSGGFGSDHN